MANYEQFTSKHYLSARLKALRSEKGITQKQLAEQLNTSISSIISYENSIRFPSSAVLGLLSRYFNVSKEYLLGETDERRPAQKWDDPELIQAVRDNLSALFDTVEQAVRGCNGGAAPHTRAERHRPAAGSPSPASRYGSRRVTLAGKK